MPTIERSIDVNVPVQTAYDQWREFEKVSQFREGVKDGDPINANPLYWKAEIASKGKEREGEFTEQTTGHPSASPHQSVGLTSGVVIFQPLSDAMSKVLLQLPYTPEGVVQNMGDGDGDGERMGVLSSRMQGELERFKTFIESRGQESGALLDYVPYQAFP